MGALCDGSTPTVSVSIVASSSRTSGAAALAERLSDMPVRIIADPDPGRPLSVNGLAKQAWLPWARRATHHLVLQDDVLIPAKLARQVADAAAGQPTAALSFFSEWGSSTSHALRVAAFAGRAWVGQPDTYLSTIAMLLPVDVAAAFSDAIDPTSPVPDDEAAFAFVRSRGLSHYASNPNLVQLPSTGDSRATVFLPDAAAPRSWWRSAPLDALREIPAIDWREGEPISYEAPLVPGEDWRVRPRGESVSPHARRLTRILRDRLLCSEVARSDLRAAAALLGAATVLCDQMTLASQFGAAPSGFGELAAREAAATLAAGTLRQRVSALVEGDEGAEEIRTAFLGIHDDVRDVLDAADAPPPLRGDT